jgi:hypothetical protein
MSIRRARLLIGCAAIALAVVLYAISFFLPAIKLNISRQPGFPEPIRPGHVAFVQGLFGLIVPTPAEFVWIANPAFWVAIGTAIFGRWRIAGVFAVAAIALALTALLIYDPNAPPPPRKTNHMQLGAPPSHVLAIGSGYYCWVSSFVCLALAALSLVAIDAADVRSKPHSLEFSPEFRRGTPGPRMPARRSGPGKGEL